MKLFRSSCKQCENCIPTEFSDPDKPVDILFIGDTPTAEEEKNERPFSSDTGKVFRGILGRLGKEYNFTHAFSYFKKNNQVSVEKCIPVIEHEILKYKPKMVIFLGLNPYMHFTDKKNANMMFESSRVFDFELRGEKFKGLLTISPSSIIKFEETTYIGFLYSDIEKALGYVFKGVDLNVNHTFKTEVLSTIKDVRSIFKEFVNTKSYVAVDTETINLNRVYENKILTSQFSNDGKVGYVIPWSHFDSPFTSEEVNEIRKLHYKFFSIKSTKVRGYIFVNSKFDRHQFARETGVFVYNAPVIDCSFNEFLLEENAERFISLYPAKKDDKSKRVSPFSLAVMAYKRGITFYEENSSKEKRAMLHSMPMSEWIEYAALDVTAPWRIYQSQLKNAKLQKYHNFKKMAEVYGTHLSETLTYVEHCGIPVNKKVLTELMSPRTSLLLKEMEKIVEEFCEFPSVTKAMKKLKRSKLPGSRILFDTENSLGGRFDPKKRIHLETLFFDILGLEPLNEHKKSVDKNFQKVYKDTIPEVGLLETYNRLQVLYSNQIQGVFQFMDKDTGNPDYYTDDSIRASYFSTAVTGRLKASNPNVQQRVSRGERSDVILNMYQSRRGRIMIKLDQSTFEVRGLSFCSGDKAMSKMFHECHELKSKFRKNPTVFSEEGLKSAIDMLISDGKAGKISREDYKKKKKELIAECDVNPIKFSKSYMDSLTDFHKRSASLFYNIPILSVSKDQRSNTKTMVFGTMYGRSPESIAKVLGISVKDAEVLQKLFRKAMPEASVSLQEKWPSEAQKNLYVESPIGRRRRLWGYLVSDVKKQAKSKMNRLAMNSVIQGICSDFNIIACSLLIRFANEHGKLKYQTSDEDAWFIHNLVHDAIEMEIPVSDLPFFLVESEKYVTEYLSEYIENEFGFKLNCPIEVDYDICETYYNKKSWNGSKESLKDVVTWAVSEINKRDNLSLSAKKILAN